MAWVWAVWALAGEPGAGTAVATPSGVVATDAASAGIATPTGFSATHRPLTEEEQAAMVGVSWHEGCPVALADLERLDLMIHTVDGAATTGTLVVNRSAVAALTTVFSALWDAGFPVARMEPVESFGGSDDTSMAANNTSAFNCRNVPGGATVSQHAYGLAVDVNPLWNPYVTRRGAKTLVLPPTGTPWLDRLPGPGVILDDGPVVRAFAAVGWRWGGRWRSSKDYQHFSQNGR